MARLHKLTDREVKNEKRIGLHSDGGGLYLKIASGGTKSWVLRYSPLGKSEDDKRRPQRDAGLGGYPAVSLKDARERAADMRKSRANGVDPIDDRNAKRKAAAPKKSKANPFWTFADAAHHYLARNQSEWTSAKHCYQWSQTLRDYAFPIIGNIDVADIEKAHVFEILEPLWNSRHETAKRLRGRLEVVIDHAIAHDMRSAANPATWNLVEPRMKKESNETRHHPSMGFERVASFVCELREKTNVITARALEFLILTATRTSEILGAQWTEIDFDAALWVIPKERMKGRKGRKREHRVPLTTPAMNLLQQMHEFRQGKLVFPGALNDGRALSEPSMLMLMRRMGYSNEIAVPHGFRATFRTWCAEATEFEREVCEMCLAHDTGSTVEQAYRRGDFFAKRRRVMEAWADHVEGVTAPANVIPLPMRLVG